MYLFLALGWTHAPMGKYIKQILYYLTGYGFVLWGIYRFLTLTEAVIQYNTKLARNLGFTEEEIKNLDLE